MILYELHTKWIDHETLLSLSLSDYKHTKEHTIHVHKYIYACHILNALVTLATMGFLL